MLTIYVVNKHGQNTVYRLWPKPFTHLFILQLTLHHSISKQLPNSDPPKVHLCLSTLPTNMTSSPAFNFQQKTILVDSWNHDSPQIIPNIHQISLKEFKHETFQPPTSPKWMSYLSSPQQDTPPSLKVMRFGPPNCAAKAHPANPRDGGCHEKTAFNAAFTES